MKKIYLVIAGVFLILLIITSIILSLRKKSTTTTQKNSPFPTSVPDRGTNKDNADVQTPNLGVSTTDSTDLTDSTISTIAPVETED
ncbi:MAG: hypothetical protein WC894_03515, partial [Patescibacteria group bacterium]